MANSCVESQYYSGQGSILIADRDIDGNPTGFTPVGNVSSLAISLERSVFEHKESCSGVRGVDLEITQEFKASMSMVMESLDKKNLALALYGTASTVVSGSAAAEAVETYLDKWCPLARINVSSLVVTKAGSNLADATTAPIDDPTVGVAGALHNGTYMYKYTFVDAVGGETLPSSASAGAIVTDANGKIDVSGILAGGAGTVARNLYRTKYNGAAYFLVATIAGNVTTTYLADNKADDLLGKAAPTVNNTTTAVKTLGTDYEVNLEAGAIKPLSTGTLLEGDNLSVAYNYTAHDAVEAMMSGSPPIKWVRFEGLNTAANNLPVVIDVFKWSVGPLAELALINDELAQMTVEGAVLSDALRPSGSKFFRERFVIPA